MKRIVLFRFHKEPEICKNRLELIKKLNPGIKIYAYFEEKEKYKPFEILNKYLEHVYFIKGKTSHWFWFNPDLAIRMWFKDFGKNLDFDVLHLIEWDLLLLEPLDKLYSNIPEDGIALTGLKPMKEIKDMWNWTSKEPHATNWRKLLSFVKEKYNYNQEPYACIGPGPHLPKAFLEKYIEIEVPELCHEEIRLPLFGQILGFKLYDTGFYGNKWYNPETQKRFNCMNKEIKIKIIKEELKNPNGVRVFHPFRKIFDLKLLK